MPRPRDPDDPKELRRLIEGALRRDDDADAIVPMLERLERVAREGSDERTYAERHLAELVLESNPWRAAVLTRSLTRTAPLVHANWALLALAHALLGNYRSACAAYQRALSLDPGNPWYSHNLGHLLDVALDQPERAIKLLERATRGVPDEPAIACSLVHALWRSGDLATARSVLAPLCARGGGQDPDVAALAAELDRAETSARRGRPGASPATEKRRARAALSDARDVVPPRVETKRRARQRLQLTDAHLPLLERLGDALSLDEERVRQALALLLDYAEHASAPANDEGRALLAGGAVLALARVDGCDPLPVRAVARSLGLREADLRVRVRTMLRDLAIEVDDPRYAARR